MAMRGNLLAVLGAEWLEVYIQNRNDPLDTLRYRRISRIEIQWYFSDAALTFTHGLNPAAMKTGDAAPLCTLRLCVASEERLFVYDVSVSSVGEGVMHEIWNYPPDGRDDMTRPQYSKCLQTVTWFSAPQENGQPKGCVAFAAATVPIMALPASVPETPPSIPVYTFSSLDTPALHFAGVRDYDEMLGILVLGSACGELVLYDLTGRYAGELYPCLQNTAMPLVQEELLPTVRKFGRILHLTRAYVYSRNPLPRVQLLRSRTVHSTP